MYCKEEHYHPAYHAPTLISLSGSLQSSDWPFLVTTGQAKDYATDRFREHVERFEKIADMIDANSIDDEYLKSVEAIDNCFPVIDYRVYLPIEEGKIPQQEAKLAPLYNN